MWGSYLYPRARSHVRLIGCCVRPHSVGTRSSPRPFLYVPDGLRPRPGHTSTSQWFCTLQFPSAPGLGGHAHSRFRLKSPCPVPCFRALSHRSAPPTSVPHLPVSALSHQPVSDVFSPYTSFRALSHPSVPIPTNHRPPCPPSD
jgi:hypothetical protein